MQMLPNMKLGQRLLDLLKPGGEAFGLGEYALECSQLGKMLPKE